MSLVTALACPRCGAPITYESQFCAYCRAALVAAAPPALSRGNVLQSYDFTKGIMLPGVETYPNVKATMGVGLEYTFPPKDTGGLVSYVVPQLRNGSAILRANCADPYGKFGIRFRVHRFGASVVNAGYGIEVRPAHQQFHVYRLVTAGGRLHQEDLVTPRTFHTILGPSQSNEVEIRFADSVFNVVLNGVTAHSFVDARYGFGHAAVHVAGTGTQAARITLEKFELRGPG